MDILKKPAILRQSLFVPFITGTGFIRFCLIENLNVDMATNEICWKRY